MKKKITTINPCKHNFDHKIHQNDNLPHHHRPNNFRADSPISAWNFANDYIHQHQDRVIDQRRKSAFNQLQQPQYQQPISIQSNRWQLARAAQYHLKN